MNVMAATKKARGGNRYLGGRAAPVPQAGGGASMFGRWLSRLGFLLLAAGLIFGVSVGFTAAYRWLTVNPYFRITEVRVQGLARLTRQEILDLAGVREGENSLAVNMSRVKDKLAEDPWIDTVSVRRELPGTLGITVTEKSACYLVKQGEGLHYADRAGAVIAPVTGDRFASLPVLVMDDAPEEGRLEEFTAGLRSGRWPFVTAEVDWVVLKKDAVVIGLRKPAMVLRVGAGDLAGDLTRAGTVLDDLQRRGELSGARRLSAFGGKVWVGMDRAS